MPGRRQGSRGNGRIPRMVLDSSMVEHSAVNRVVVGSSPTRGVSKFGIFFSFLHIIILIRRLSQVVRHGTATP